MQGICLEHIEEYKKEIKEWHPVNKRYHYPYSTVLPRNSMRYIKNRIKTLTLELMGYYSDDDLMTSLVLVLQSL
ncbi:unnamed protein product [Sympodiomycopsis kandeliae]